MTIVEALDDLHLFGPAFADRPSWAAWEAFVAALFGLPMSAHQLETYRAHTGRTTAPRTPAREAWVVAGRRGGKSRIAALVAVYLAAFRDYRRILARGERGTLPIIAADRRQARTVLRYVLGLLEECPMLAQLVVSTTADGVELTTGVTIEVHTASFRSVRGYTVVAAILDEIAFWRSDDSANPDREIINALRPAMATVPGALLLAISSPYARRGVLWEAYRRHYGHDSDVLVWQAATRTMNPRVPDRLIAEALEQDEAAARAEYLAEFRRDLEAFVPREVVDGCTVPGRVQLPPLAHVTYSAFVDPSGGSADSFTLAIAHREPHGDQEVLVVDVLRERRAPFNPSDVVAEYAALLATYDVTCVTGDRYAGEWPREAFRRHDITYEPTDRPKSELYRDLVPLLTGRRVELPDDPRLHAQLCALERRTGRGGRDTIDHPPGGHDDIANAVAGALVSASAADTAQFLFLDSQDARGVSSANAPFAEQLRELFPVVTADPEFVCRTCENQVARTGRLWCKAREFIVTLELPACEYYVADEGA